jgi:glutathione S-transferase
VALMLELSGADWEPRRVAFFTGQTRSPEFREMNVMGEVPVLTDITRLDGDVVLSQSGAILDYLSASSASFGPPMRRDERRNPALAAVGQPQADQLCGDLPVHEPFSEQNPTIR